MWRKNGLYMVRDAKGSIDIWFSSSTHQKNKYILGTKVTLDKSNNGVQVHEVDFRSQTLY